MNMLICNSTDRLGNSLGYATKGNPQGHPLSCLPVLLCYGTDIGVNTNKWGKYPANWTYKSLVQSQYMAANRKNICIWVKVVTHQCMHFVGNVDVKKSTYKLEEITWCCGIMFSQCHYKHSQQIISDLSKLICSDANSALCTRGESNLCLPPLP